MKAMILAAGLGTRMRPLTDSQPKPMLPVADKPLLDWALDRLDEVGCEEVLVNLHYLGDQIKAHLKSRVRYISEDPILETGGGVKNALDHGYFQGAPFYVCNADNLWLDEGRSALARLAEVWDETRMDGLLLLQAVERAHGYEGAGDFCCERDGGPMCRLRDAKAGQPAFVFTGVQILHPRLFENAPNGAFSLNVLYDQALAAGRLCGVVHDGAWYHVGTPESLAETDAALRGDE
jgi:MurNAc alpha-1-phosphate uridylyltransferase